VEQGSALRARGLASGGATENCSEPSATVLQVCTMRGVISDAPCQCPCCDYYALAARGRHLICPVCYWEDDGQDLGDLDEVSVTNHITLRQGRRNFARMGAADEAAVSLVAPSSELSGLRRENRANG
jgi:hypothetical protein